MWCCVWGRPLAGDVSAERAAALACTLHALFMHSLLSSITLLINAATLRMSWCPRSWSRRWQRRWASAPRRVRFVCGARSAAGQRGPGRRRRRRRGPAGPPSHALSSLLPFPSLPLLTQIMELDLIEGGGDHPADQFKARCAGCARCAPCCACCACCACRVRRWGCALGEPPRGASSHRVRPLRLPSLARRPQIESSSRATEDILREMLNGRVDSVEFSGAPRSSPLQRPCCSPLLTQRCRMHARCAVCLLRLPRRAARPPSVQRVRATC